MKNIICSFCQLIGYCFIFLMFRKCSKFDQINWMDIHDCLSLIVKEPHPTARGLWSNSLPRANWHAKPIKFPWGVYDCVCILFACNSSALVVFLFYGRSFLLKSFLISLLEFASHLVTELARIWNSKPATSRTCTMKLQVWPVRHCKAQERLVRVQTLQGQFQCVKLIRATLHGNSGQSQSLPDLLAVTRCLFERWSAIDLFVSNLQKIEWHRKWNT